MDQIKTGNFNTEPSKRGWRVGHFADSQSGFQTNETEFQWKFDLKADEAKASAAYNRRSATLTILVEGEMMIRFPHENRTVTLSKEGDYAFFAPGVCHQWKVTKDSKMVGIRWPSIEHDQVPCDHIQK